MNTPIFDFAKEYSDSKAIRLHMPGHKGLKTPLGIEDMDITEFDGADNLWAPDGIIKESEANASLLFGATTFYSTEGSSLSIRAMLFLTQKWALLNGRTPLILAGRNVHKTFITAAALLDINVDWIMQKPEDTYQSCTVTPQDISDYIASHSSVPAALYITTPDYLGNMLDVKALADKCHSLNMLLIVDNAHGAYLKFLPESLHPMDLGADLCCDSAHKTLPAITGAAYLHVSKYADPYFSINAKAALSLFASTSPSYLIMESLDLCNAYLSACRAGLEALTGKVKKIKDHLLSNSYVLVGSEPVKITIKAKEYGYTGDGLAEILSQSNIFTEYHDEDYLVMMFTESLSDDKLSAIEKALLDIPRKAPLKSITIPLSIPERVLSFREALYSDFEVLPASQCVGRILQEASVSCPPCVPVYMSGERIDRIFTDRPLKVVKP